MQTQVLFWAGNAKLDSQIVSCFETIPAALPPPGHHHGGIHELIKICGLFIQTGLEVDEVSITCSTKANFKHFRQTMLTL